MSSGVTPWRMSPHTFLHVGPRLSTILCKFVPKGGQNAKWTFSVQKLHFAWRKSATKFLCMNIVSQRVHSCRAFTGLSNRAKWLIWTSPSTWNFGRNWPTSFKNANFQSIFARSASAVTPSEKKVQLTRIGSHYELSNKPKMNRMRCL